MSDLFEKSMRTLELPAVLEMLAQRAVSDEAICWTRQTRPRPGWGSTAARPLPA